MPVSLSSTRRARPSRHAAANPSSDAHPSPAAENMLHAMGLARLRCLSTLCPLAHAAAAAWAAFSRSRFSLSSFFISAIWAFLGVSVGASGRLSRAGLPAAPAADADLRGDSKAATNRQLVPRAGSRPPARSLARDSLPLLEVVDVVSQSTEDGRDGNVRLGAWGGSVWRVGGGEGGGRRRAASRERQNSHEPCLRLYGQPGASSMSSSLPLDDPTSIPSRLTRKHGALLDTELEAAGGEAKGRESEDCGDFGHGCGGAGGVVIDERARSTCIMHHCRSRVTARRTHGGDLQKRRREAAWIHRVPDWTRPSSG